MKLLNFLFAILLVGAMTSCDATKNIASTTPNTNTGAVTNAQTPRAPAAPKVSTTDVADAVKIEQPELKNPTLDKPKIKKPTRPTKPNKENMSDEMKEKMAAKRAAMKDKMGDKKKPMKPGGHGDHNNVKVNAPGSITWEAANHRYSASGTFNSWRITDVKMIGDDLNTLTAKLEIDLASIWEKNPKLTNHLKADDYFGVEEHQLAVIDVVKVTKGDGVHTADMVLKMRGKEQKLKGTFSVTTMKPLTIAGSAMMDRSIFGIGVENTSVPNEIKVMFDTVVPR